MIAIIIAQFQVLVPPTSRPPTIDGVLSLGEWDSSAVVDISDTLGADGNRENPGDCVVYAAHDPLYLYLAFDCHKDTVLADHSQPSAGFDDDNSGSWPSSDTTEGINALGSDNGWFCSWWLEDFTCGGWYPSGQVIYSFSDASGHVVCEWAIPLLGPNSDSGPQFIGTSATHFQEDTVGVFLFYSDAEEGLIGYWPQNLPLWYDPAGYGDFILVPGESVAEGCPGNPPSLLVPSVATGDFAATLFLPREARVSLALYSATGAKVCEIFQGRLGPGAHTFTVPGQPSGIFFLRAEIDGGFISRPVALIR